MSYKIWIIVAVLLFGTGILLGLNTPPDIASLLLDDFGVLKELSGIIVPYSFLTFFIIFVKNVSALMLSFLFSPLLCLTPVLTLTANGWLIALISASVAQEESLGLVLAGLLPHGIFELPALIMGQAAALSSGTLLILALFKRGNRNQLLPGLRLNIRYFVMALGLLLPAAIIETYITPLFMARYG